MGWKSQSCAGGRRGSRDSGVPLRSNLCFAWKPRVPISLPVFSALQAAVAKQTPCEAAGVSALSSL